MKTIDKKIMEVIKNFEKTFAEGKVISEFEKTNNEFKRLVKKGIVKKRGNNLLTSSEATSVIKVYFNTK